MNTIHTNANPASRADVMLIRLTEPVVCALPDFVKIPAVPGLPTTLTGAALRNALRARADTGVSPRRN